MVSVLVPCYNGAEYLYDCLVGINSQTYQNFEVIFINDGSTDDSLNIFQNFTWRSDIGTTIIDQENKGFLESLLGGMKRCNGDVVARCDADDVWHDFHLQRGVNALKEDENLVLVGSRARLIDNESKVTGISTLVLSSKRYLLRDNPFIHSSVLFKRNAYDNTLDGYDNDLLLKEHFADYILFVRLSALGDIYIYQTPSLDYRILGDSMSRRFDNLEILKSRLMCIRLAVATSSFSDRLYGYIWIVTINLRIYVKSIISIWRKYWWNS